LEHEASKKDIPKTLDFKLSGDGRQHREGKVGYCVLPLNSLESGTQSGEACIPILVYNGKDTKKDLTVLGARLKEYFSTWSIDESKKFAYKEIVGIKIRIIYLADMVNIWHTCFSQFWVAKGSKNEEKIMMFLVMWCVKVVGVIGMSWRELIIQMTKRMERLKRTRSIEITKMATMIQ